MTSPKSLRVLIVEDDLTSRFVLRRILEALGEDLEVYEAEDGLKAWETLNGGLVPHLCFLDLKMPRMNGVELLQRIRSDKRFTSLPVCFCSAVRDRHLIEQAAALQPDHYILKPYDRQAIHAQVQKVRGSPRSASDLEAPAAVCARLGIEPAAYELRLRALLENVGTLATRLPTLLMQSDVEGGISALDATMQAAQDLGACRILWLAGRLSRALKSDGSLPDRHAEPGPETAAKLQQWLNRTADQLMQTMHEMHGELQTVERLAAEVRLGSQSAKDASAAFKGRQREELDGLIRALTEVFRRGKLPQVMRLRQAIGPDFEAFMRQQEVIVRENLARLTPPAEISGQAAEEQVQEILQDVRGRLQPALDGKLTAYPVFSQFDLGNLEDRSDGSRWAMAFSLLHHAALLFRTAIADPDFDRTFQFKTFDRQAFLASMNVFGGPIGLHPDAGRAAREIQQLGAVATSPVSLLEKCRLVWGIMNGAAEPGDAPPEVRLETSNLLPSVEGGERNS